MNIPSAKIMPSINWSLRRHDLHIHFRHNFRGISFSILIPLIVKSIQLSLILFDSPHFQRDGGPDDENISFFSSSSRYSSVSLYILWRLAIALWRPVYSGYFRFKRPRSGDGFSGTLISCQDDYIFAISIRLRFADRSNR